MKLTKAEINQVEQLCGAVVKRWQGNETMSLQKFAIRDLADTIYPHYIAFAKETNELLFKYIETENGKPKYKAQIIDINAKEQKEKEFIWKTEEGEAEYNKLIDEYLKSEVEVDVRKYELKDLLETKITLQETEIYQLIKYIAL
jgi:hypothetical protein